MAWGRKACRWLVCSCGMSWQDALLSFVCLPAIWFQAGGIPAARWCAGHGLCVACRGALLDSHQPPSRGVPRGLQRAWLVAAALLLFVLGPATAPL